MSWKAFFIALVVLIFFFGVENFFLLGAFAFFIGAVAGVVYKKPNKPDGPNEPGDHPGP